MPIFLGLSCVLQVETQLRKMQCLKVNVLLEDFAYVFLHASLAYIWDQSQ